MTDKPLPKVGAVIDGVYRITDRRPFCGRLPYAEIVSGPNTGVQVILCRWETRP